jgi:hypothetical protein
MRITNYQGRQFLIRVVNKGDRYGLDDCLVHDETSDRLTKGADPLIEFYDLTHAKENWPRGQFVSRYYAHTLSEVKGGLNLCGHEPVWQIDAEALAPVVRLALEVTRGR